MLQFTLASLFTAMVAGTLGFGANPGNSGELGKMLFLVFIQLFLIGIFSIVVSVRLPRQAAAHQSLARRIGFNT